MFDLVVGGVVVSWTKYYVVKRRTIKLRRRAASYFRAIVLLTVFSATIATFYFSWPLLSQWLLSIGAQKRDFVEFAKGFTYPLLIIAGLPILFALWAFRDANAREKLANDRKDVNLKEFQELQARAAGLFAPDLPAAAVESLQVASIYQMAGFLRGEYGLNFQRPTFEALRVLARQFSIVNGSQLILDQLERAWNIYDRRYKRKSVDPSRLTRLLMETRRKIRETDRLASHSPPVRVLSINLSSYAEAIFFIKTRLYRFTASKTNWSSVVFTETTFANSHFSYTRLEKAIIQKARFHISSFTHCNFDYSLTFLSSFWGCNIQRIRARRAQFQSCAFVQAFFWNCDLRFSQFEQCDFRLAQFRSVDLRGADLREAKLTGAQFAEADLRGCDLRAIDPDTIASAQGSRLNQDTLMCLAFDYSEGGPFEIDVDAAKDRWIAKGAIFEA